MKLASSLDPILHIGKGSVTPEVTASVSEALEKRELVKLNVLKNNFDEIGEIAQTIAERTNSQVVQVIGRKIVLYRPSKTKPVGSRIVLP